MIRRFIACPFLLLGALGADWAVQVAARIIWGKDNYITLKLKEDGTIEEIR